MTKLSTPCAVRLAILSATLGVVGCFHEEEKTHVYDDPISHLHIIAPRFTEISVTGRERTDLQVTVSGYYRLNKSFSYTKKTDVHTTTLTLECLNEANHFFAYVDIEAPDTVALTVDTGEDLFIRDMREKIAVNATGNGRVMLSNIEGDVFANVENGVLQVEDATGTIHASSNAGGILLRRIHGSGATSATDPGEENSAADAVSTVVASTNFSGGDIDASGITGNATFTAKTGNILAEQVTGRLNATTGFGDIIVDGCEGDLLLYITEEGNIVATEARCGECYAETAKGVVDASWTQ